MTKFITLAMTETRKNQFAVLALDVGSEQIYSFDLEYADIVDKSGRIFWDIGKETEVERVIPVGSSKVNMQYHAEGRVVLGRDRTKDLKPIFEKEASVCRLFFYDKNETFAVAKMARLHDLTFVPDKGKSYMRLEIKGDRREKIMLNKDYRWLEYWKWILGKNNEDLLDEKRNKYIKLFNERSKTLYLILYRHKFAYNSRYWIAGMHWL